MVHPTSRNTEYTLLDEIRYHFGNDANLRKEWLGE